jgi:hypothetical protein
MLVKISNVGTDPVRLKQPGQADIVLPPGRSLLVDEMAAIGEVTPPARGQGDPNPVQPTTPPTTPPTPYDEAFGPRPQPPAPRLNTVPTGRVDGVDPAEDLRQRYAAAGIYGEEVERAIASVRDHAPPAPVVVDGWTAGSGSGGPGRPVDPVPNKERPEPPNNGKVGDWDPNRGIAGMPAAKRKLYSDFG